MFTRSASFRQPSYKVERIVNEVRRIVNEVRRIVNEVRRSIIKEYRKYDEWRRRPASGVDECDGAPDHLDVAAQVETESKIEAKLKGSSSYFSFKCLVSCAFTVGLIGSTCTALP